MLLPEIEVLTGGSNHGAAIAAAASGQGLAANLTRNGLLVQVDPAATGTLYLLLAASGTPSATNYDVAVSPTLPWDGLIGTTVWRGAVQYKWTGAGAAGIAFTEV